MLFQAKQLYCRCIFVILVSYRFIIEHMKIFSYHILFIVFTAMGILNTNNVGTQSGSLSRTPEAGVPIADNPLLANWSGPYGGVPPFDKVRVDLFEPALEAAMEQRLEQTEKIASSSAPPTFENTIAALEKSECKRYKG